VGGAGVTWNREWKKQSGESGCMTPRTGSVADVTWGWRVLEKEESRWRGERYKIADVKLVKVFLV
jgi:hypothetical protein